MESIDEELMRQKDNRPPRQVRPISKTKPKAGTIEDVWLEPGLSSLSGPHRNRPWVQLLRALIRGAGGIA